MIDAKASGTASHIHGHNGVLTLLYTAAQAERLAHAYVLVGPSHVGKMTVAVHLAQLVNCDDPTPGPCGACRQCMRVAAGHHSDIQVTSLPTTEEGAQGTQIRIEQVRELRRQASLRPYEGRTRVFIIQDAELLTNEAANSLLKYLEEPPPNVLLLLLAADEDALLPTVLSRCQRLELRPMPFSSLQDVLTANYGIGEEQAALISRLSGGCPGWAISAVQDESVLEAQLSALDEQVNLAEADLGARFRFANSLGSAFYRDRPRVRDVLALCQLWWMDLALCAAGAPDHIVNIHRIEQVEAQSQLVGVSAAHGFIKDVARARNMLERNVIPRLALEWLMLKMPAGARPAA